MSSRHVPFVLVIAGIVLKSPLPQVALAQQSPKIVWSGVETHEGFVVSDERGNAAAGELHLFKLEATTRFRYIQETDGDGNLYFSSRQASWQADGVAQNSVRRIVCKGANDVVFDASNGYGNKEALDKLKIPCKEELFANAFGYFLTNPTPRNRDRISLPKIVSLDKLRDGCSYSEESAGYRYSVWVSQQIDAVIEVDPAPGGPYADFVPEPGRTVAFTTHSRGGIPVQFRFVLDRQEVSRFPGYTSNASIDDAFFERAGLQSLRGSYKDADADLVFDPAHYENRSVWNAKPLGFGGTGIVETVTPDIAATVTVTAMDYGATGKLRAFVKTGCGGWEPVAVRVGGTTREFVNIPLDEDNNLIADKLQDYAGAADRDDDAEPAGDGTKGDGLSAFEEYRGFATAGGDCDNRRHDVVVRTDPAKKDLFIHAPDPEIAATTAHFEWASGVAVHLICEPHFLNNTRRVINHTLQSEGLREWNGIVVSQRFPQHGLFINDQPPPNWGAGEACVNPPDCTRDDSGPPVIHAIIMIDKGTILSLPKSASELVATVTHETGHAVGLAHHGDSVQNHHLVAGNLNVPVDPRQAPFVIAPGPSCIAPRGPGSLVGEIPVYRDGKFIGCAAASIAIRGAQNSGNAECPMRYSFSDYYEGPGASIKQTGAIINQQGSPPAAIPGGSVPVLLYSGKILSYRNEEDFIALGRFCPTNRGTMLNDAARGDLSHAGDALVGACQNHIVINDLAVPGWRR